MGGPGASAQPGGPLRPDAWIERIRGGDRLALAKAISAVEQGAPEAPGLLAGLSAFAGGARRIGVTGAPGAGKSTIVSGLIPIIRAEGRTAAVVAVDPSSPLTGGAVLGDRIRMTEHVNDPGVYMRSMAGRGRLGGLSAAAPGAVDLLDGAGFDVILIETVGVGQSEVEIMHHAQTTVVVMNPGWGDGVSAGKAGLLEIGDVFAVNKADRPGAARARRDLEAMLALGPPRPWRPPVLETAALDGAGLAGLWEALEAHAAHLAGEA